MAMSVFVISRRVLVLGLPTGCAPRADGKVGQVSDEAGVSDAVTGMPWLAYRTAEGCTNLDPGRQ